MVEEAEVENGRAIGSCSGPTFSVVLLFINLLLGVQSTGFILFNTKASKHKNGIKNI